MVMRITWATVGGRLFLWEDLVAWRDTTPLVARDPAGAGCHQLAGPTRGEKCIFLKFFYLLKRIKIAKISPGPRPSWAPPASPGRCAPLPRSGPFAPAAIFIIIGILFTIKFIPCQQPQEHWEDLKEWRKSNFAKWQYFTTLVTDADVRARKSLTREVVLPYFALFLFFIPLFSPLMTSSPRFAREKRRQISPEICLNS